MKNLKQILKGFTGLFAAIYIVAVKHPLFQNILASIDMHFHPHEAKGHPEHVQKYVDILVVIAITINYYFSVYNPEKKYEKAQAVRKQFLKSSAQEIIQEYKDQDYTIKMNVMAKRIGWVKPSLLKNHKFKWWPVPVIFKKVWWPEDDISDPPDFKLGVYQGSTGISYQSGQREKFRLERRNNEEIKLLLKLNDEHLPAVKNITLLVSIPIYKTESQDSNNDAKLLGVLTFECSDPGAGMMIEDVKTLKEFYPNISEEDFKKVEEDAKKLNDLVDQTVVKFANIYRRLYF